MTMKACEVCGTPFESYNGVGKYCSRGCARDAYNARRRPLRSHPHRPRQVFHIKCRWCGTAFETDHNRRRYCNDECMVADRKRRGRLAYVSPPSRRVECAICGGSFEAVLRRRYCSQECSTEAERRRQRDQPLVIECLGCGKTFETPWPAQNYCSKSCRPPPPETMGYKKYFKTIRSRIIQRDGGRCQICHEVRPRPLVHHIVPRPVGSDHPDNLITLCRGCHHRLNINGIETCPGHDRVASFPHAYRGGSGVAP